MSNDNNGYILVAGYGWSGSSAAVDLLKEYSGCDENGTECRIVKDPYGLSDLEMKVVDQWDPLNTDIAIRDFIWHMEHLDYVSARYSLSEGLNYKKRFNGRFYPEVERFLSDILEFNYESDWWFLRFKMSKFRYFIRKFELVLKIHKTPKMYFTSISAEKYREAASKFIDALYAQPGKRMVMDQAVPAQDYQRGMRYFKGAKLLIIDRDPRDIYADLLKGGNLIGKELASSRDANKYVAWHKAYRRNMEQIKNDPNVLYMMFEDLVLNYDESVKKIEEFFGLDPADHTDSKKLFDPSVSARNIGFWKDVLNDQEKTIIEKELAEYLR